MCTSGSLKDGPTTTPHPQNVDHGLDVGFRHAHRKRTPVDASRRTGILLHIIPIAMPIAIAVSVAPLAPTIKRQQYIVADHHRYASDQHTLNQTRRPGRKPCVTRERVTHNSFGPSSVNSIHNSPRGTALVQAVNSPRGQRQKTDLRMARAVAAMSRTVTRAVPKRVVLNADHWLSDDASALFDGR